METSFSFEEQIEHALREINDPELGYNIVDLGLIYGTTVSDGRIEIAMTLTTPGCPLGDTIEKDIKEKVGTIPGVRDVNVKFVWDPAWSVDRINEELREELGL